MGILLFLVFVLVVGWFLAAALSKQKPPKRRTAIRYPCSSPSISAEITVDAPEVEPEVHEEWSQANVIRPPEKWSLERNRNGSLVVDADWKFILDAKSDAEWQLYVYSIKNYPDLLKIGISKDAVKRKEKYYKKKLHLKKIPKREAIMVEHLFKHATYHLANTNPPRWNVSNIDEDNLIDEILEFSNDNYEGSGLSEIRKMSLTQALNTLERIYTSVHEGFIDEAIEKWGIKTFDLKQVVEGRSSVEVPHLRW